MNDMCSVVVVSDASETVQQNQLKGKLRNIQHSAHVHVDLQEFAFTLAIFFLGGDGL